MNDKILTKIEEFILDKFGEYMFDSGSDHEGLFGKSRNQLLDIIKEALIDDEFICPVCGKRTLEFYTESFNLQTYRDWNCPSCNATGSAWYEEKFIEHSIGDTDE